MQFTRRGSGVGQQFGSLEYRTTSLGSQTPLQQPASVVRSQPDLLVRLASRPRLRRATAVDLAANCRDAVDPAEFIQLPAVAEAADAKPVSVGRLQRQLWHQPLGHRRPLVGNAGQHWRSRFLFLRGQRPRHAGGTR